MRTALVGPSGWSFEDAKNLLLSRLDAAWKKVLACHVDMGHLNDASKEYRSAKDELEAAEKDMWALKNAWGRLKE